MQTIEELSLQNRRVLMRCDLDVPLEGDRIADDTLVHLALPSIRFALDQGARLVLAAHLPESPDDTRRSTSQTSLEPVAMRLAELLREQEVRLTDDCIGDGARKVVSDLREGQLAVLENLRLHTGEELNDEGFARELARLADVYVNDAFRASQYEHASVHALARCMPERGVGLGLKRELDALTRLLMEPPRPFTVVLGGQHLDSKLTVLQALMERADALLVGGALANSFLAAQGLDVGTSELATDKLALVRSLLQLLRDRGVPMLLPLDVCVGTERHVHPAETVPSRAIPTHRMVLDIGPRTVEAFRHRIMASRCVLWNGPMGVVERAPCATGTHRMATALAECTGFTVAVGDDTVAAVHAGGLMERLDHVSGGGQASFAFLQGRKLPGVEVMRS